MFLLLCLILFIWGIAGLCSDYDHEAEVRNARRDAERRHREALEQQKNLPRTKQGKKTTRYIARDKDGRVIGKEVIEE